MTSRHRLPVPERLLLPPAPRDPEARAHWDMLPFEERLRLARCLYRTDPSALTDQAGEPSHWELLTALAATRWATRWRLWVVPPLIAWLAIMTVWGFGRSTDPTRAGWWALAGLAVGVLGGMASARTVLRRLRAVRTHLDAGARRVTG